MILSGISGPLPPLSEEDEGTAEGPSLPPTSEKQRRMFNTHISCPLLKFSHSYIMLYSIRDCYFNRMIYVDAK